MDTLKKLCVFRARPLDGAPLDHGPDSFLEKHGRLDRRPSQAAAKLLRDRNLFKRLWHTWTINPCSSLYYGWLFLMSLTLLYNLMFIIVRAVLPGFNSSALQLWLVLDYICDVLYLIDIFVRSRRTYFKDGHVVHNTRKLALNYVSTFQFKLDILSILPTDLLYILYGLNASIVRINRCLRAARIAEFFSRTDSRTNYAHLFRFAQLALRVIIAYNWNACIFYQISVWIGICSNKFVYFNSSCPQYMKVENPESMLTTYTYIFYWSTLMLSTLCDVAHPVEVEEYIYAVAVLLTGIGIFSSIVGIVGGIIASMNITQDKFHEQLDGVKHYMLIRKVDKEVERTVIRWFDYIWSDKRATNEEEVLSHLPQSLRAEMARHVHLNTLKRVAIFQDCDAGLLTELVLKLRPVIFSPEDFVCRKGDIGKELYIIKRGKLQVVSDDGGKVFATLGEGVVFGEISILNIAGNKNGNKRTANIRSVGYTDLYALTKEDLWETLTGYPDARNKLIAKGRELLRKDNLLDEDLARQQSLEELNKEEKLERLEELLPLMTSQLNDMRQQFDVLQRGLKKHITCLEAKIRRHMIGTGQNMA